MAAMAKGRGRGPGYNAMKRYNILHRSTVVEPDVFFYEKGYYIIKFQSTTDVREVLYAGSYSINNKPIILKSWIPEFDFTEEFPIGKVLQSSLELNLANFSAPTPISVKNRFEVASTSICDARIPPRDKGGGSKQN